MSKDKIEKALSTALRHLEDSLKAMSGGGDENAVSNSLWSASAETEYALFLLSLMHRDKSKDASWKHGSSSKHSIEFKPILTSSLELLKKAKAQVEASNFEKGYEATWTARNLLLKAQELLDKKRKGAKN